MAAKMTQYTDQTPSVLPLQAFAARFIQRADPDVCTLCPVTGSGLVLSLEVVLPVFESRRAEFLIEVILAGPR